MAVRFRSTDIMVIGNR